MCSGCFKFVGKTILTRRICMCINNDGLHQGLGLSEIYGALWPMDWWPQPGHGFDEQPDRDEWP